MGLPKLSQNGTINLVVCSLGRSVYSSSTSVFLGSDDQLPNGYDGNDAFRWPLNNGITFFLKSNLTFHSLECDFHKLFKIFF